MAICKSQSDLKADALRTGAKVISLSEVYTSDKLKSCGSTRGRGFSFEGIDKISFPPEDEMLILVDSFKEGAILKVSAVTETGAWIWVPVWALRKSVPQSEETEELRSEDLYQEILRASNDPERIRIVGGKTFTVKTVKVLRQDPRGGSYYYTIFCLRAEDVAKAPRSRKPRK